jgi:hypothetical protein
MVPWFDSIAYNAVMCSLPRFYGNEGIQPDSLASRNATCRLKLHAMIAGHCGSLIMYLPYLA